ncbi:hypothetical protein P43SY_002604 [Pythium insidiosum]|uniref:LsmAD domain-containing protein n=1 Tax=Pythium insidiosum TaxID=114742 RepID=A0AAD5LUD2_PYTIN|nr:hypothetical protein P43SY_002604 [Pythium insidiosum]
MNYAAAASKGSASRATAPPPSANGSKKLNKKKPADKPKANGRESGETKSPTSAPPPGFAPSGASSSHAAPAPPKGFSESQQRLLRHRALFVFRFLVGKAVEVQLVDSSRYVGILDCIDPDDFSIVLKNTQRKGPSHGESFDTGSTVIFKRRQLAHMSADGVVDYSETAVGAGAGGAPGFRTDTEISGRSHDHLYGRELQTASSWLDPQLDTGALEESRRRGPSSKSAWNQFEANEKLFGVVSTFDENLYTTKLDRGKLSTEQSREAERIAREIERETTGNFHLQEERGQRVEREDLDEEALYSSVDRKATASPVARTPNAYVPPALRNAARQTSGGASPVSKSAASNSAAKTSSAYSKPTTPAVAAVPAPAPASASAAAPTSATRKAISFSEAVTGRPAAAPTAAPQSSAKPAAPSSKAQTKAEPVTVSPKAKAAQPSGTPQKADAKSSTAAPSSSAKKSKGGKPTDAGEVKASPDSTKKADEGASAAAATPAKKGLNPNAKEFKLSAAAPEFTPKFMAQPSATSSPYRQPYQAPAGQMYPPPPMGMGYAPMPEEWMYDGTGMMEDGGEYMHAAYMGYGVPMMPNPAMMQQPVYPPMMPQPNVRMMSGSGGQRPHSSGNYAYPHPHHPSQPGVYNNARGYYQGAAPGAMPYAGGVMAPGSASPGVPQQPPLPREPTPSADTPGQGKAPSEEAEETDDGDDRHARRRDAALAQRIAALELENERFRDELAHLRHLVSNNHQQRDDERLMMHRVNEDMQRLTQSVQTKALADATAMQREQHKAALLFAEVARLGQHVESIEQTLRSLQIDIERDRNALLAGDAERSQWMADVRAALVKNEALIEAKTASHLERLTHKMTADKMELVRLVEETRELLAGTDLRRVSAHLSAFSRLSDHLLSLERWIHSELSTIKRVVQMRWIHSELSTIKRVVQMVLADSEGRTSALLSELRASWTSWSSMFQHADNEWRSSWTQLHDAVLELATHVQTKLFALEDVVPMEVKARQKHDDKLRRRVEGVVKSMTKAIETLQREVQDLSASSERRLEAQRSFTDAWERLTSVEQALTELSKAPRQEEITPSAIDVSWRDELHQRLASVVEELARRENEVLSKLETVEGEHGEVLASLQQWTAGHAVECRQYFEYLSWKMETLEDDRQVESCVRRLVDMVAEQAQAGDQHEDTGIQ